jgi:predicted ester cyclase
MSEQENINITRKVFENLNKHDLKANDPYFSDQVQSMGTGVPTPLKDREGARQYTQRIFDGFPDLRFNVRQIIAQGDWVSVTYEVTGKQSKPLMTSSGDTIPPTGRVVTIPGVNIYQFKNDKVIHQEVYWDQVNLLTQLGLMTGMPQMGRSMK